MKKISILNFKEYIEYVPSTGKFYWLKTFCRAKKGMQSGYGSDPRYLSFAGIQKPAARWAWYYVYGQFPTTHLFHINGNENDDRIDNLRLQGTYKDKIKVTQEILKDFVIYNPETGVFSYKPKIEKGSWKLKHGGTCTDRGYIVVKVHGKDYLAHRLAWLYVHGEWPEEEIDHINGIKDDNRIVNLREANRIQQMSNLKKSKANTSGYKGVSWSSNARGWQAEIKHNNKWYYLGTFHDPKEAHKAYCKAARELKGEFARFE